MIKSFQCSQQGHQEAECLVPPPSHKQRPELAELKKSLEKTMEKGKFACQAVEVSFSGNSHPGDPDASGLRQ